MFLNLSNYVSAIRKGLVFLVFLQLATVLHLNPLLAVLQKLVEKIRSFALSIGNQLCIGTFYVPGSLNKQNNTGYTKQNFYASHSRPSYAFVIKKT